MHQTLFWIPHQFLGSWLLVAWLVLGILLIGYLWLLRGSAGDAIGFLPVYLVIAAIIYFVLPQVETMGIDPANPNGDLIPLGLAIRGYGFFMLLAIVVALGLIRLRCRQVGFDFEKMLTLCIWMVVCGIVGARLFYVIQKWDDFADGSGGNLIVQMLDMTKGGLVVYGSLIGALIAAAVYIPYNKMSWLGTADIFAPGMAIGLAIGRIGCLMNGCCYGGLCEEPYPAIQFPPGSPPYMQQLADGPLLGVQGAWNESGIFKVDQVVPDSLADKRGIKSGDELVILLPRSIALRAKKVDGLDVDSTMIIDTNRIGRIKLTGDELPERSLAVHPTQIYSSANAFLIFLVLWFYYPFRKHAGEVLALMLIMYPIGRSLLEVIRTDEAGQFGTSLTISQWVSVLAIVAGVGLWFLIRTRTEALKNPALVA